MTEKPITSLSGDQWLKLIEAEKQKILQIDFAKDIKSYTQGQTYLEDAQKLYLFDAFSASVKEWNSLREQCVEIAFTKLLYPMLRKELRYVEIIQRNAYCNETECYRITYPHQIKPEMQEQ